MTNPDGSQFYQTAGSSEEYDGYYNVSADALEDNFAKAVEVLKNLECLEKDVFFMSFSPLPIKGLDSSPVRAYAIEGIAEFS